MKPHEYGKKYYCVKVSKALSEDGEIYAYADEIQISEGGDLKLICSNNCDEIYPGLIIAKGQWLAIYAASCFDGSASTVEHWCGEVHDH